MAKAKLICVEGCDGAGKSTQIKLIKEYLESKNLNHTFYHFPMYGHNQFSDTIARFLRGEFGASHEVDPLFVANAYAMDRFRFLPQLEEDLENFDVVILDRYVYSNVAYQSAKYDNELDSERMKEWILEFEFGFLKLPYPDLNLFLNVPSQVTKKRLEEKREGGDRDYLQGKEDVHEADMTLQEAVRNQYLNSMIGAQNCKIVDCAIQQQMPNVWDVLTPDELFGFYKKYIDHVLFNTPL